MTKDDKYDILLAKVEKLVSLFYEYEQYFGFSDDEWSNNNLDESPQDKQCHYEEKFRLMICEIYGHNIGPDSCCMPEHDLCYECGKLRVDLEKEKDHN